MPRAEVAPVETLGMDAMKHDHVGHVASRGARVEQPPVQILVLARQQAPFASRAQFRREATEPAHDIEADHGVAAGQDAGKVA
jgi:hypothetical protein